VALVLLVKATMAATSQVGQAILGLVQVAAVLGLLVETPSQTTLAARAALDFFHP
jgi:hypothetical protein